MGQEFLRVPGFILCQDDTKIDAHGDVHFNRMIVAESENKEVFYIEEGIIEV